MSVSIDECMYVVVEFTEERTVAAIPSIWLSGNNCAYWPPYKDASRCKNAAKRKEVAGSGWESFPIKVWLRTDEWDEAIAKVRRLEEQSQTESADQKKLGPPKRRIRSPDRYQWSDEGDASSCSAELDCRSLPKLQTAKRRKSRAKRSRQLFAVSPSLPPQPISPIICTNAPTPSHVATNTPCTSFQVGTSHVATTTCTPCTSSQVGIARSNDMISIQSLEPIFNRIFKTLEEIKADQKKLLKKQRAMEKVEAFSADIRDMFPLKSQEEINEMEIKLQEPSFQDGVLMYLRAFSGRCVTETVRRMLQETMGHEIAKYYNLTGKGNLGKKGFQLLGLYRVIFEGVRRSNSDTTDTEFRVAITNWFDGVKDREGGRKSRKKKTLQGPDIIDAEHQ